MGCKVGSNPQAFVPLRIGPFKLEEALPLLWIELENYVREKMSELWRQAWRLSVC
jgi:hypothetical protein